MAKISFLIDKAEIIFDDVKDDLAHWLALSFSAYHGLVPSSPAPLPISDTATKLTGERRERTLSDPVVEDEVLLGREVPIPDPPKKVVKKESK